MALRFPLRFHVLGLAVVCSSALALEPPIRINAGGPALEGWLADKGFVEGGSGFSFKGKHDSSGVPNPGPTALYETVRHQNHRYRIPVPAGRYLLRIHFAEKFPNSDRAMDYVANGVRIVDDFTPYLAMGSRTHRVHILEAVVEAKGGGGIVLECDEDRGNDVFEAGIEILKAPQGAKVTTAPVNPRANGETAVEEAVAVEEIRRFVGRDVRFVWLESKKAEHYTTEGSRVRLLGLDTARDTKARDLLGQVGAWSKPIFTEDGQYVVYSDRKSRRMQLLSFEGGQPRDLGEGFAADVWRDPGTGQDWVYFRSGDGGKQRPLLRRRLDNPGIEEGVWSGSETGHEGVPWFQLSADGNRAGDAFPWSKCGVAFLDRGRSASRWQQMGSGCWAAILPDNSYRAWHFNGSHRDLTIYQADGSGKRTLKLGPLPGGVGGGKVYHPRQSNHVSYITVTGPENSSKCDLFLGRFNKDQTAMDGWVQVTRSRMADIFGEVWVPPVGGVPARPVEIAKASPIAVPIPSPRPAVSVGGGEDEGLVFRWSRLGARNEIAVPGGKAIVCAGTLRSGAIPGPFEGVDLRSGWLEADGESARRVAERCRTTGEFAVEAIVTSAGGDQAGPARILTSSGGSSDRNFTLGEEHGKLVLRLRTTATDPNGSDRALTLGPIQAWRPTHVMVSFAPGELVVWIDGREVHRGGGPGGDLTAWKEFPLLFGDEVGGTRNWAGLLRGVEILSRRIPKEEAARRAGDALKGIAAAKTAQPMGVEARLVQATPTPSLKEIHPYRRGLVEDVFEVVEGKSAGIEGRIVVVRWAVLDGGTISREQKVGATQSLLLVPWEARPGLASENRSAVHDEFSAPVYLEVSTPGRPPNPG